MIIQEVSMQNMNQMDDLHRYDDIIHLPHHVSVTHPPMDVSDRAAQFSPFAALTGHGAAIHEAARLTDQKMELDEDSKETLNEKIMVLIGRLREQPAVTITYFVADGKKEGGYYTAVKGNIKKIDEYEGLIILVDETRVPLCDVIEIEGDALSDAGY